MTAFGRFPYHVKRIERIVFIALMAPPVNGDIPAKAGVELVRAVAEHLVGKFRKLVELIGVEIAQHSGFPCNI